MVEDTQGPSGFTVYDLANADGRRSPRELPRLVSSAASARLGAGPLSCVRSADRIYVLRAGAVVEEGTHEDLLARDGLYAEMFSLQAAAYR